MFNFIDLGNGLINVALLLVILVALVVIHEFGHFLVARRTGVKVHEFGIGFPPRAATYYTDKKGTAWTLNWLPIGGFVRMEGEEGESDDPHSFVRQRLPTRLAILLAGVGMNILLAFVIFTGIAWLGDPVANVRIAHVQDNSPAASVGLTGGQPTGASDAQGNPTYDNTGDVITAIDGKQFLLFDHVDQATPSLDYLRSHAGQQVILSVQSADGSSRDVPVTLRTDTSQGALGVIIQPELVQATAAHDLPTAITLGFQRTVDAATLILRGLGDLIGNIANPPVAGPVGIVGAIGQVRANLPPVYLIWFIGLLSANLAIVNALPFPPLDGGRVAVSLIQAATGNRIGEAAERLVYLTGFIALMALLVWVTFNDIQRLT
ncbi:MAG TPA: M50 family metallopeptidase [Candidatus Limnocylindrales bacterium]|jgi:regulator of sigma E protease